ncbi:MAG: B12-binding domain-containing radical SAM protein [Chitinispirillaceae bacterium]|nr:B12-binding domain-containing radical SAM protein [Chitinispirillaceae bacterium]
MRLYLVNPCNPLVSVVKSQGNRWNKYNIWKPLGLLVLAGLTPDKWEISIFDENIKTPEYYTLPLPDLVGITAFTSQASRAYDIAATYRRRNVPVVMGGIHTTMCPQEAMERVNAIVTGEAESVWREVLSDCCSGTLRKRYDGVRLDLAAVPPARHDLLSEGYHFGSIQTSRGCPLSCSFCSVTAFNGGKFRRRPVEQVIEEFRMIREKNVLIVDDNLIGTSREHIGYTKILLREMIAAKLGKQWIAQVTINMADDDELLTLAKKAGCTGVFIGFETVSAKGLAEVCKKFAIGNNRDMKTSVRNIQLHGISVLGSFILGLDIDKKGSGTNIAETARTYGLDILNVMVLTPLPGTRLWKTMEEQGRLVVRNFPRDWKYFTLTFPVARFKNLSWRELVAEREKSFKIFYSYAGILHRVLRSIRYGMNPLVVLISNLIIRANSLYLDRRAYVSFNLTMDSAEKTMQASVVKSSDRDRVAAVDVYPEYTTQSGSEDRLFQVTVLP